jgi:hypothetical protein
MKRTTKYVGLDVHQASTVAAVREESGRIIGRSIFATEESLILEFFRGIRGTVHVAFEEGTQAQWLYDLLKPRVHRVVVCDRARGEEAGEQGRRSRCGAALERSSLRAVYHDSAHRVALPFTRMLDSAAGTFWVDPLHFITG